MTPKRRRIAWFLALLGLAVPAAAAGDDLPPVSLPPAEPRPRDQPASKPADPEKFPLASVPAGLPRYEIDARLDPAARLVTARERIRFTNRSTVPVTELVFHVYPRYKVPEADKPILSKTMEVLRLSPEEAMDPQGRRLDVSEVRVAGKVAPFTFDPQVDTIMVVPLAKPLPAGGAVAVEIAFSLSLPEQWGRWGNRKGVTYLTNWYPILAHHDETGWEHTPFVPWHQPWHQDAGHYTVRFELPEGQKVASTGRITREETTKPGWRRLTIAPIRPARDFALVCSDRFEVQERQVGHVKVRVAAFPDQHANAEQILNFAAEVIPLYEHWFGPYAEDEMEYVCSFFGWNGNECSGLVQLDGRVLSLPAAGIRYIDHLVTHETCHQWWWNAVGTDGYAETFMDEGLVNSFTAMRLDAKYGRNAPLIVWPRGLTWLPTIGREDLRLAGYYGWRARGNGGPVIQDLKAMGDLGSLFSLAYDRGGKIIEMIRNRLGEERFFDFWRKLYHEYAFETLRYADFRRELAEFDPKGDWPAFLDGWVINHAETDWAVGQVDVGASEPGGARPVTVVLRQDGAMVEPTVLMCRSGDNEVRVPIWPDRGTYDTPGAHVERRDAKTWAVSLTSPGRVSQVLVDPDHALLDAKPDNNRWKPEVAWRLSPLLTSMDESSQFQAFDRPSIVAGPFVDMYARGGFKVAAQRLERWQISGWAGTEPALNEAIFGGQATLLHFPWPRFSSGFFYEEGLYNFYNDKRHSGGRAFLHYTFLPTSSFLVDDAGFAELYYGLGNEFWAGDDGRPVNAYLGAVGARFRLNTQFPYWDPVQGYLLEATAEYGNSLVGSAFNYVRITGEAAKVFSMPPGHGYFSRTRLALRAYGGYGSPSNEPLFRLGGGRRLRALDLSQYLGSSVLLGTAEWRFPIWRELDQDFLDHVLGAKNLSGAFFYDVGSSYFNKGWNPVVGGIGGGLRLDVAMFSFLERATIRFDLAQPVGIGRNRGPVLWFGLNQAF